MSFGNKGFDPYKHCKKTWNLEPSEIEKISRKRTYKKFVEYTIDWIKGNESGQYKFKVILNEMELEDM